MKKIFISAAVVAASVFGVYTANQNIAMAEMSDLQLEDVEALGQQGDSMIDHMWAVGNQSSSSQSSNNSSNNSRTGVETRDFRTIWCDGRPRYYEMRIYCPGTNPSNCVPSVEQTDAMKEQ